MMQRCTRGLPLLASGLAMIWARPAVAADPFCPVLTIEADASVGSRWPGLRGHAHQVFDARGDIDRCARVELTMHDAAITVAVVLPDGRSATRSLSRGEDIVPTIEALLLVPQRGPEAEAPTLGSSTSPPAATAPPEPPSESSVTREVRFVGLLAVPGGDAAEAPTARRPTRLRIELSVLTGARIGDGQTSVGLGAFSLLDVSGWLVGFEGRADRYRTLSSPSVGTPDSGALELALLGGRRLRFRNVALDLVAGLAEVLQGTTTFQDQSTAGGSNITGSSSSTVPRLLLGARLNFSALSTLHTFVGMDGELGPPRDDSDDLPVVVPRLPIWTMGLALGATVGTQ